MKEPENIYSKTKDIVSRSIADESVLVPIKNNIGDLESIFTLNSTAARIWELIDGKLSLAQIKDILCSEYEVESVVIESDIFEFIDSALEAGLIISS